MIFKTSICRQIIKGGLLYDYKLAICICPLSNQLNFKLKTITTEANKSHTSEKLYGPTPLHVFNWLKEQIAELLKSSSNQQKQKTFQKEPLEFKKGKEDWNNLKNSLLISVNGIGQTAYKHLKMREGLIRRETEYYNVEGELHDRMMNIEFKQGKSGRKYIQIVQRFIEKDRALFINFPKIPLTEDIYRLLDAMRAMSNELEEKRPTLFIGENKPSTICQKLVKGFFYNYKMELHSLQNQQLDFRLKTIPNKASKGHKPEELVGPIPIDIFKWMMEQIVEILEDYYESDGNEK